MEIPLQRSTSGKVSVTCATVSNVTQILGAMQQGDLKAASELLPLVYQELRRLAAS